MTAEDFQWSPGLAMVNKNNYTLTYSGHGSISSHAECGTSPARQHTSTLIITLHYITLHHYITSLHCQLFTPSKGSCPCQNVHPEPGEASILHTAQLGYALIGFCKLYEFYFYDRTEEK